jgi:hypothetical protein
MDPLDEAIGMIRETNDIKSLRQELTEARKEAAAEKLRANAAEKAHTDASKNFE